MTTSIHPSAPTWLGLLASALVLASCGGPGEDVRIRLCRDIAAARADSPISVYETAAQTKGYEHARVRVRYRSGDRDAEMVCYYDYNAVEDTAQTLSQPLSAYAATPSRVTIDGEDLNRAQRADAISRAMMNQGRELIDRAKGALENVIGQ